MSTLIFDVQIERNNNIITIAYHHLRPGSNLNFPFTYTSILFNIIKKEIQTVFEILFGTIAFRNMYTQLKRNGNGDI